MTNLHDEFQQEIDSREEAYFEQLAVDKYDTEQLELAENAANNQRAEALSE